MQCFPSLGKLFLTPKWLSFEVKIKWEKEAVTEEQRKPFPLLDSLVDTYLHATPK